MAAASIAGPVLGGVLIQLDPLGLGWRAALLLTVPVGILAILLAPSLPSDRLGGVANRVDPIGACLSLAGLALLVFSLTAGRDAGWPPWTWVCLVAGSVLLAGFVVSQRILSVALVHPSTLAEPATK